MLSFLRRCLRIYVFCSFLLTPQVTATPHFVSLWLGSFLCALTPSFFNYGYRRRGSSLEEFPTLAYNGHVLRLAKEHSQSSVSAKTYFSPHRYRTSHQIYMPSQHQGSKSDKAMVSVKPMKQLKSFLRRLKKKEENSEPAELGAFHRFTELPREIRNMIYYYALPDHSRMVTLCTDGGTNARWLESLVAKARVIMTHGVIKPQMSLVTFAMAHDFLKVKEWRSAIPLALYSVSSEAREEARKGFDFVSVDGVHGVPMKIREDTLLLGSRSEYYVYRIPNSATISLEGGCCRNVVDLLEFMRRMKQIKRTKQDNALYQVRKLMITHAQWLFFSGTRKQHFERFLLYFRELETLKFLTLKPYIHYPEQQPMGLLPLSRSYGRTIRQLFNRDLDDIQIRNPHWQRPRLELWVQWPIYQNIGGGPERQLLWAEPTLFTDDLVGV